MKSLVVRLHGGTVITAKATDLSVAVSAGDGESFISDSETPRDLVIQQTALSDGSLRYDVE